MCTRSHKLHWKRFLLFKSRFKSFLSIFWRLSHRGVGLLTLPCWPCETLVLVFNFRPLHQSTLSHSWRWMIDSPAAAVVVVVVRGLSTPRTAQSSERTNSFNRTFLSLQMPFKSLSSLKPSVCSSLLLLLYFSCPYLLANVQTWTEFIEQNRNTHHSRVIDSDTSLWIALLFDRTRAGGLLFLCGSSCTYGNLFSSKVASCFTHRKSSKLIHFRPKNCHLFQSSVRNFSHFLIWNVFSFPWLPLHLTASSPSPLTRRLRSCLPMFAFCHAVLSTFSRSVLPRLACLLHVFCLIEFDSIEMSPWTSLRHRESRADTFEPSHEASVSCKN